MDQETIKIPSAKLCLTAMTLRGVGPYGGGARLEFRPITILCGTNGGGKSTWIRALRTLKAAAQDPWFPLRLVRDDPHFFYCDQPDADGFVQVGESLWSDPVLEREFGAFGSIGLEIDALDDFQLDHTKATPDTEEREHFSPVDAFFHTGQLHKGDRIRLRLGDPCASHWRGGGWNTPQVLSSLFLNEYPIGQIVLGAREDGTRICSIQIATEIVGRDEISSSMQTVSEFSVNLSVNLGGLPDLYPIDADAAGELGEVFLNLIRAITTEVLNGLFALGPIRETQMFGQVEGASPSRYVGYRGEESDTQLRLYFNNSVSIATRDDAPEVLSETGPKNIGDLYALLEACLHGYGLAVPQLEVLDGFGIDELDSVWDKLPPASVLMSDQPETKRYTVHVEPEKRYVNRHGANISRLEALSTGFHQLKPIIVQALLMKPGELFTIENPEAHLHPKLQVRITEFLLRQATTGKVILIETHSDLVVRRVIRAMWLDEEISQRAVHIYFASIRPRKSMADDFVSIIEQIQVNDKGRIANWPEGFMDEDIKQSRRLLDIMYSKPDDNDD